MIQAINSVAVMAQTTPKSAKAGSSQNVSSACVGIENAGKSPICSREIIAPATLAITTGAKAFTA